MVVVIRIAKLVDVDVENRDAFFSLDLIHVVVVEQTVFERTVLTTEETTDASAVAHVEINRCTDNRWLFNEMRKGRRGEMK